MTKKTNNEIFTFIAEANKYLATGENEKTKLGYAIKKMIGEIKIQKRGRLSSAVEGYYEDFEDIENKFASTDEKKNIIKPLIYTDENRKKKRDELKKLLYEKKVDINPHIIDDVDLKDLTEPQIEFFQGFVIPEQPKNDETENK